MIITETGWNRTIMQMRSGGRGCGERELLQEIGLWSRID